MAQYIHAQPQPHSLHGIEGEIAAHACQCRSALVAEEDQAGSGEKQSGLSSGQHLVNQPLENQRGQKRQKTGRRHAEETGNVPRHKGSNLFCQPTQFTGNLQRQRNLTCSSRAWTGYLRLEVMHPALTASSENSLRSAFVQFLATASENKEYCLGIRPDQRVRDSDRLRSGAMVDSQERKKSWSRTDAEEKGPQPPSQADRS